MNDTRPLQKQDLAHIDHMLDAIGDKLSQIIVSLEKITKKKEEE